MADITPDYKLEIIKLKANIAALMANLANYRRDILEHKSRQTIARNNIVATKAAIKDIEVNLGLMINAHGDVDEKSLDEMV